MFFTIIVQVNEKQLNESQKTEDSGHNIKKCSYLGFNFQIQLHNKHELKP